MKKWLFSLCITALLALSFAGCSNRPDGADSPNPGDMDNGAESSVAPSANESAGDAAEVETPSGVVPWNKTIVVNGAAIEIGCSLEEFRDATGFDLVERLNNPGQLIFSDGHSRILVYITPGWSPDETDYSSLFIGLHTTGGTQDAALSDFDTGNSSVIFDGGISIGSTLDEMLAAYGDPDFTYGNTLEDGTETEVYNYPAPIGESGSATIEVDTATNLVYSLSVYHEGLLD